MWERFHIAKNAGKSRLFGNMSIEKSFISDPKQAIQSIFCSKKGNIAREINGCFLNKTSHIMVFMHKNKRFMHKCIRMHKKKTRESRCIISDVTRREREQKTPD